jgi:hypothetical protein
MHPVAHDSADVDTERTWQRGTILQCAKCDESIIVADPANEQGPQRRG